MELEKIIEGAKNTAAAILIIGPLAYNVGLGAYRAYCGMPLVPPEDSPQFNPAAIGVFGGLGSMIMGINVDSIGEYSQGADFAALGALALGVPYMAVAQCVGYGLGTLARMVG